MTVKSSRFKIFLLVVLSIAAAIGLKTLITYDPYEVASNDSGKIAFAFYCLSAVSILAVLALLFSKTIRAQISPEGLFVPNISNEIIPWSDIENMGIQKSQRVKFIIFNLKSGAPSKRNIKFFKRFEKAVGSIVGIKGHTINMATSDTSAETFLAGAQKYFTEFTAQNLLVAEVNRLIETGELEKSMHAAVAERQSKQGQQPVVKNRYSTVKPSFVKPQNTSFGQRTI